MQNNKIYEKNSRKIKVLFINRRDYLENLGGDTIQMLSIKTNLENEIESEVQTDPNIIKNIIGDFDIIHIFNLQRISETAFFVKLANKHSKKIILSPIYADFSQLEKKGRSVIYKFVKIMLPKNLFNLIKDINRLRKNLSYPIFLWQNVHSFEKLFNNTLNACDFIIPNSNAESDFLKPRIKNHSRINIIHNGIDENLLENSISESEFRERYKISFKSFVLCVARIDERKNILNLLKATDKDNDIKIVLIGKVYPTHKEYYKKCASFIRPNKVIHINATLDQKEICGAYKAAHTHALVSWLETPGLASLEAGVFGVNLVLGRCKSVEEYFKDYAYYCYPDDLNSIYHAVKQSLTDEKNHFNAKQFIIDSYSLKEIAKQYLKLYSELIVSQ